MATDDRKTSLEEILQHLNTHVEGLEQLALIRQDGALLAQIHSKDPKPPLNALLTEFAALTGEVCQTLERGANTEAMIKGQKRFLALYRSQAANLILGIVGSATVNFGLLNSGCRIAIQKIEHIRTA